MIQSIISRLAGQSTTVKGWCITVTAALLGFGVSTATSVIALIAVYVVLAFAVLDAYYLALERAYRALYSRAVADQTDQWTLTIDRPAVRDILTALASPVILIVYGTSLLTTAVVGIYTLAA
jgi:hypothetical protein